MRFETMYIQCLLSGWLAQNNYGDFAGSGVVHLLGATCAFVACLLIRPRMGRFDEQGKPMDMPGHSVPLAGLGGFILLFGFLAFNGGSQLAMSNEGDTAAVARAIVNTVIGGCGGGLSTLVIVKCTGGRKWSYLMTLNGALTGMVRNDAHGC
jgi:Amt family ammonium transporter